MIKLTSTLISALILTACSTAGNYETKTSYYSHTEFGTVSHKDERFQKDRDECRAEVYSKGIEIDGELITTSEGVFEKYFEFLADSLAKDIRSSQYGGSTNKGTPEPPYYDQMTKYNKEVDQCKIDKGWVFIERK